jgi:kojibiose phosphorylase
MLRMDPPWKLSEDHIPDEDVHVHETLLTLGNGYLGSRGVFEEGLAGGYAGTYLAGVYDESDTQSSEIVNLPNPLVLQVMLDGDLLSPAGFRTESHHRWLDFQHAVLRRDTAYHGDPLGRILYRSLRFFSLDDIHIGAQRAWLEPGDRDVDVLVRATIDCSTLNAVRTSSQSIRHYEVVEVEAWEPEVLFVLVCTHSSEIRVGFAVSLSAASGGRSALRASAKHRRVGDFPAMELSFRSKGGCEYIFDRLTSIYTSRDTGEVREACRTKLLSAREQGLDALLKSHEARWEQVWESAHLEIEGEHAMQEAVRFNQYHLLIASPLTEDVDASIPAKTLSGEWYKGHVFWDTEIYALPFFIYSQPEAARNMLLYRYRRMPAARENAARLGYAGALWPWESADSGRDETPDWWVNFDGSKIPVYNREREHHIAGDVIYALANYYRVTRDESFMIQCGAEMAFETARFWVSRVTLSESREEYEIRGVIGPNEFQELVNDNAYTNFLARWTLRYAADLYMRLAKDHGGTLADLAARMKLREAEVETWRDVASKIKFTVGPDGLIEEFDGYFQRDDVVVREWDENGMPLWPGEVNLADVKETQLIKQADVVLLLTLFPEAFSDQERRVNLDYYEPRTTHKSSLSPPSYAILSAQLGEVERAHKYCLPAAYVDLRNVHGNTDKGMHAAAIGGAWQMVVHGFGGLWVGEDGLRIWPRLPRGWGRLSLRLCYRGVLLACSMSSNRVELEMLGDTRTDGGELEVVIFGERSMLPREGRLVVEVKGEREG